MSQYVNFFIRSKSDEFIPLTSYCRSNAVYSACENDVPYEKIKALTSSKISSYISNISDDIKEINDRIKKSESLIESIKEFNNSIEDKTSAIFDELSNIDEEKELLEYLNKAIQFFEVLADFIDDKEYDDTIDQNKFIYAGIEISDPTIDDIVE